MTLVLELACEELRSPIFHIKFIVQNLCLQRGCIGRTITRILVALHPVHVASLKLRVRDLECNVGRYWDYDKAVMQVIDRKPDLFVH